MRRVLNVAEKPSVAKEVARLLSQNTAQFQRTWCAAAHLRMTAFTLRQKCCSKELACLSARSMVSADHARATAEADWLVCSIPCSQA